MDFRQTLVTSLIALVIPEASDTAVAARAKQQLSCSIRSVDIRDGIRLEAVVIGTRGTSGEYEFVVADSGGGSSTDITQGGTFLIGPSEDTVLGEVTIGLGKRANLKARLSVSSDTGTIACEESFPRRS